MEILHPPSWPRPKGYSNGVTASGKLVVTAGLVGWDQNQQFVAKDLTGQTAQVFQNIVSILAEGGAKPEHIIRMTWYITNKADYLESAKEIGFAYRETFGKHFPAMAVVEVSALMEDEAKVEIEVMAVIPG